MVCWADVFCDRQILRLNQNFAFKAKQHRSDQSQVHAAETELLRQHDRTLMVAKMDGLEHVGEALVQVSYRFFGRPVQLQWLIGACQQRTWVDREGDAVGLVVALVQAHAHAFLHQIGAFQVSADGVGIRVDLLDRALVH